MTKICFSNRCRHCSILDRKTLHVNLISIPLNFNYFSRFSLSHDSVNDAKRKDIKRNEYWNVVCNIHTPKKTFLIKVGGQI